MSGGKHIRAIGPDAAPQASATDTAEATDMVEAAGTLDLADYTEDYVDETAFAAAPARFAWIAPALAIAAIAVWSGLYGWAMRGQLATAASVADKPSAAPSKIVTLTWPGGWCWPQSRGPWLPWPARWRGSAIWCSTR